MGISQPLHGQALAETFYVTCAFMCSQADQDPCPSSVRRLPLPAHGTDFTPDHVSTSRTQTDFDDRSPIYILRRLVWEMFDEI